MSGPRVRPATRSELGLPNYLIARISARAAKTTAPLNLFTTMGRNRGMFRRWLRFAGTLMPRGGLPRVDTELVILRVSHRTGAEYEAVHHRRMGRAAGLSAEQVKLLRPTTSAPGLGAHGSCCCSKRWMTSRTTTASPPRRSPACGRS